MSRRKRAANKKTTTNGSQSNGHNNGSSSTPSSSAENGKHAATTKKTKSGTTTTTTITGLHLSIFVIILSILVPFILKKQQKPSSPATPPEPSSLMEHFLTNVICNDTSSICHPHLEIVPSRRQEEQKTNSTIPSTRKTTTQRTTQDIPAGETLFFIPDRYLLWESDASNDVFIDFLKITTTDEPMDPDAYLAALLLRQLHKKRGEWNDTLSSDPSKTRLLASYYTSWFSMRFNGMFSQVLSPPPSQSTNPILPLFESDMSRAPTTFSTLTPLQQLTQKQHAQLSQHPILWSPSDRARLLGKNTLTDRLVQNYRTTLHREHATLSRLSASFNQTVDLSTYLAARLWISQKSFSTAGRDRRPPSRRYRRPRRRHRRRGVNPLQSLWDHHPHADAAMTYDESRGGLVVTTLRPMTKGRDVTVNYGWMTDGRLLTRYGFVNGDGSGWTGASLAVYHPVEDSANWDEDESSPAARGTAGSEGLDEDPETVLSRVTSMARYVRDDGYSTCISRRAAPASWGFKMAKVMHLSRLARLKTKWTIRNPPRNPGARPGEDGGDGAESLDFEGDVGKDVIFSARGVMEMCRLAVLTEEDLSVETNATTADGDNSTTTTTTPTRKLITASRSPSSVTAVDRLISSHLNPSLEYRSLHCLERLVDEALSLFPPPPHRRRRSQMPWRSNEWNAIHVRHGEMTTLKVLRGVVTSEKKKIVAKQLKTMKKEGKETMTEEELMNKKGWKVRRRQCHVDIDETVLFEMFMGVGEGIDKQS